MSYLPVRPGTAVSLFQHGQPNGYRTGIGAYDRVGDWTWEFFGPNAYGWERPLDSAPQPAPIVSGLSGCGCGGSCGGCGHKHGMGQVTLFSSMDISTWGWGEWAAVAAGALLLMKVVSGGKKAAKSVKGYSRKRARRAKALASL